MEVQHQSSDRISALPQYTIEKILTHMPIRDAIRTSILSKKWRYCWTRMRELVLYDNLVNVSSGIEKYKFFNAIFHVLSLHKGPISVLKICIVNTKIVNEIDQIIHHLSWSKIIKTLCFELDGYMLPCSFFAIQELEHLDLTYCKFELPLLFNGFSMLKSLTFEDVRITANMLQRFLTNCPLLQEFSLEGYDDQIDFTGGKRCTFVELFKCLPAVRYVKISRCYVKHLAAGGMPQKLATSLVYLRKLVLDVCFLEQDEILSVLSVIRSSPNLTNIKLTMFRNVEQTFNNLPDLQDYSGLNLDNLKELEIKGFHNYAPEVEFVKFIMAKSPMLMKARIELDTSVPVDEENKMLQDLVDIPLPRASPAAKFIIQLPKLQIIF